MILQWEQIHCISKTVILPKKLWDIDHAITKYEYSKNHFNKHAWIFKAIFLR